MSLCNAFPALFDHVNESATTEVDGVSRSNCGKVVEQCYLAAVFEHNGVPVRHASFERCYGMPRLELGDGRSADHPLTLLRNAYGI